jgi:hypothetical protein
MNRLGTVFRDCAARELPWLLALAVLLSATGAVAMVGRFVELREEARKRRQEDADAAERRRRDERAAEAAEALRKAREAASRSWGGPSPSDPRSLAAPGGAGSPYDRLPPEQRRMIEKAQGLR